MCLPFPTWCCCCSKEDGGDTGHKKQASAPQDSYSSGQQNGLPPSKEGNNGGGSKENGGRLTEIGNGADVKTNGGPASGAHNSSGTDSPPAGLVGGPKDVSGKTPAAAKGSTTAVAGNKNGELGLGAPVYNDSAEKTKLPAPAAAQGSAAGTNKKNGDRTAWAAPAYNLQDVDGDVNRIGEAVGAGAYGRKDAMATNIAESAPKKMDHGGAGLRRHHGLVASPQPREATGNMAAPDQVLQISRPDAPAVDVHGGSKDDRKPQRKPWF